MSCGEQATALTVQAIGMPDSVEKSRIEEASLFHRAKATSALRKLLDGASPSPEVVQAVWQLATAEVYALNLINSGIHTAATMEMVNLLGGVSRIPQGLRRQLIRSDNFGARVRRRPTRLPREVGDPGPFEKMLTDQELGKFRSMPQMQTKIHSEVPDNVRDIFMDYRNFLAANEFVNCLPKDTRQLEILQWCHDKKASLFADLANLELRLLKAHEASPCPDRDSHALNMATCLSLYYSWRLLWFTGSKNRLEEKYNSFEDLEKSTAAISERNDYDRPHMLLWIVFIGAVLEEIRSKTEPSRRWHLARFKSLLRRLQLRSPGELKWILRNFLYDPRMLDRYMLPLFSTAMSS